MLRPCYTRIITVTQPIMKKTIITSLLTLTVGAFLNIGCGEEVATEPTAADDAEAGNVGELPEGQKHDTDIDPSSEESNTQGSPNPR